MRNEINKSSKRSNEMLTSATKQKQWLRVGLVWVAGPGHVTSKKTKHATNFRFNLLHVKDFIEFRGFSPDI